MFRLVAAAFAIISFAGSSDTVLHAENQALQFELENRTWVDATGDFHVEAKLVEYANQKLTLEKKDRSLIQIRVDQLSAPDKQYLGRQLQLARIYSRKKEVNPQVETGDSKPIAAKEVSTTASKHTKLNRESEKMYGIDWYPRTAGIQLAKSLGREDAKPILWFRVLGELDGFM